jgi:hypothetical protein
VKTNSLFKRPYFIELLSVVVLAVTLLSPVSTKASTPLLERVITITLEQERIDIVLKKISQQGNFTFSYNPSSIDVSKIVSYSFTGMTVREVLDQLFQGALRYKARGNYVILTKAQVSSAKEFSGYVVDEATGQRLKNVSVYDPVSLSSAVTDAYGYFKIKIDNPSPELILAINKQNYTDTIVAVPSAKTGLLRIPISIDRDKIATIADSVGEKLKRFWQTKVLIPKSVNVDNITDTLNRKTQLSLLPFIGTNHKLSGNVINDYSFNIFGGYSRGVRKLELGGLFNLVREDVEGAQVAGLFNAVGGKTSAFQLAGLANLNLDTVKGAQLAGLINVNWNSTEKFSGAGLINFTHRDSRGVHLAGLGNMTLGEQHGAHLAGFFNFSTKASGHAQLSGLLNFAGGNLRGVQVSGLVNFAGKDIRGVQLASLLNVAPRKITGAQISGLLNYATKVKGAQIGFINIADSIKGIPFGFFSFVSKGYHQIEVSADEIFYTNLAFRTGVRQFYNIFTVGAKPNTFAEDETFWSFGYGIGTAPRLAKWLSLNVDVTANQVIKGNTIDVVNLLNKVYVGAELRPAKKIAFIFGVTLNSYITDTAYGAYPDLFTDYTPDIISDRTYRNDINMKMWWGGKVGLRFL